VDPSRLSDPPPKNITRVYAGLNFEGITVLAGIFGACLVALDLGVGAGWTGIGAVLGMLALLVNLMKKMLGDPSRRLRSTLRAIIAVDVLVGLALLGMLVARGWLAAEQIGDEAGEDLQAVARVYTGLFVVVALLAGFSAAMPERLARIVLLMIQRPAMLLAGSFAALIAVMSILLTLPVSVENVADVSFVNALFTVTSAVCVTGLAVNDPGSTYTLFGEVVILLSIQLGGMGIMTIAALALAFARDTGLATQLRYAQMMDVRTLADLRTTVGSIVIGTLALEAVGAVALWFLFQGDPRIGDASPAWLGLFHSVSAFCNAGFSLFQGGLVPFDTHVSVQVVIMLLIIAGGLGFPVLRELLMRMIDWGQYIVDRGSPRPPRLSLPSRVVLVTSLALIVFGTLAIFLLERVRGLDALDGGHGLLAALFTSVNTRTSGFNTVDMGGFGATTLLLMCVLMFIGGSPGSTAGGIKTTTFVTILATLRAELSEGEPRIGRRAIASEVVRRAIAVATLSTAICVVALLALTLTEDHEFLALLFETVSAFATVGLSTGITPELGVPGKLVVCATMFVGRVGPLTIALAVGRAARTQRYRLARENLPIG
jgi:trk system potassium uptake protein TrkH